MFWKGNGLTNLRNVFPTILGTSALYLMPSMRTLQINDKSAVIPDKVFLLSQRKK